LKYILKNIVNETKTIIIMEHENARKSSRSERRHRTKGKYEGTIRVLNRKDYIINSRVSKYHQDKRIRNRRAEKMGWKQGNSTTHSENGNYDISCLGKLYIGYYEVLVGLPRLMHSRYDFEHQQHPQWTVPMLSFQECLR
jgi:hypothetical protein